MKSQEDAGETIATECSVDDRPMRPPTCFIVGGETTVNIQGAGKGGRNQEMALAASDLVEGDKHIVFLSGGTDGTDGPTDAAGAIVDNETSVRARSMGLSVKDYLQQNDSYTFFSNLGDGLLKTGPTGDKCCGHSSHSCPLNKLSLNPHIFFPPIFLSKQQQRHILPCVCDRAPCAYDAALFDMPALG